MTIHELDHLCIIIKLVFRCFNTGTLHPCQVELHVGVLVMTLKPVRQEPSMDLVQFNEEWLVDSLMNDELCQRVFLWPMSVTQADLLVVLHVVANRSAVEVTLKVLEAHPKDAIKVVIHAQLLTQVALVLV